MVVHSLRSTLVILLDQIPPFQKKQSEYEVVVSGVVVSLINYESIVKKKKANKII